MTRGLIAVGKKLFKSGCLSFQAPVSSLRRKKKGKEWFGGQVSLRILPGFLTQPFVKMDCIEGSDKTVMD